jgi:DNA-binding protein Fis
MRTLENEILCDSRVNRDAIEAIDAYENSMLENINSYCKTNHFSKAIFMCGVAHRNSIAEKIKEFKTKYEIELDWDVLKF